MLHLIFQSPLEDPLLQRIDANDQVVFYENAIFQINKGNRSNDRLQELIEKNVKLYVLSEELATRGLTINELIDGIKEIEHSELVKLTLDNKVIRTWN